MVKTVAFIVGKSENPAAQIYLPYSREHYHVSVSDMSRLVAPSFKTRIVTPPKT